MRAPAANGGQSWRTHPDAAMAMRRTMAIVAALLALTWQSLFVQTHVHLPIHAAGIMAGADRPAAHDRTPGDAAPDCPACHQLAKAGRYLPARPPSLGAPPAVAAWTAIAVLAAWAIVRRSHAWHSRGPPPPVPHR